MYEHEAATATTTANIVGERVLNHLSTYVANIVRPVGSGELCRTLYNEPATLLFYIY